MRSKSKRLMTALMAVVMLLSVMTPISAFAADVTMDLSKAEVSWDYTLTDADGNAFTAAYGLTAANNPFGYAMGASARKMHDYTAKAPGLTGNKSDWEYGKDYVYCFCIEHGIPLPNSNDYSASSDTTHGNKYEMLSTEQKNLLSLALAYGYPNRTDLETSKDANACYSATQLIVWQITMGFRSSPTELNDKTYPMDGYSGTMTEQYTSNKYLKEYYDLILSDMATHYTRPSFTSNVPASAKTYEMDYVNGKYTVTLTDTNNVLSKYRVSSNGGASVSVNGNTLTISSTQPLTDSITIKLNRRMPSTTHTTGFLIWSVPGKEDNNQDMVSGVPANNDPVPSYLKIATAAGSVKIVKDSEDGVVDGIKFTITGNGVNQTVTTKNDGVIQVDNLRPGTYTVTEVVEDRYEPQTAKTVTVVSGQTATVSFNNTLKRGDLKIVKTSEDGIVSGIPFVVSGNGITKNVTTDANGEIKIEGLLPGTYTVTEQHKDYYEPQASQTVTVEYDKTATVSFDNVLKRGDLTVTKTAEDGLTEGIKFRLTGTSDSGVKIDVTATVDSTGKAYFKDILIGSGYVLEEVDTALKYIVPDSQDVEIEWAKVATAEVYNELKRGDLKVIKTSEDNFVEGMRFHLYGTSLSGEKVDVYAYTDKNGVAVFEDILIGENYTVEEVNTAIRYVIPESQGAVIEWNKVTEVKFHNVLKKWRADVFKIDADLAGFDDDDDSGLVPVELMPMAFSLDSDAMVDDLGGIYGQSQGDATLEGAVYGVFKDGALIDTYTTDKNGYFITDYYPCYENVEWTIREISPSEGYLLDETVYYIDTYAGQYTVELNTVYPDVYEDIIKGKITIIKHTDDGSTKIETPEVGAMFEIYLKSAGSYEAAETTERDILTCDEFGYAETIDLPYGVYVVKQIKGWDGRELLDPFEVFVSEDGEVYRYLINNANCESYLHVVKTDSTTGKTIPYAGAGFQIY
ncbi:MAG: Cys-Gln thioester bond-forming surface protein, partial [Tidjanibacter sp.]|nr:Cys-Gln thioester bond-forming surface protein [Tidjanibacter sp.]